MGLCNIQLKKIYNLFQKPSKRFTKKVCVLRTSLSQKLSTIMIAMNVLENSFETSTESIRSGSRSTWYELEGKFSESFFKKK